jgi:uncharacterized membrane protein
MVNFLNKSRLEAFSDGVFAIIITISVLQLEVPQGDNWPALKPVIPIFLTYIFSFIMVGIYWNNHHHMFQAVHHTTGIMLWANLHLLFWLSLLPFATGWMGNNHFSKLPVAVYGFILFMSAFAYSLMVLTILRSEGKDSMIAKAVRGDFKGNVSIFLYLVGIVFAFLYPVISVTLYVVVAGIWLIPDRRIEKHSGIIE